MLLNLRQLSPLYPPSKILGIIDLVAGFWKRHPPLAGGRVRLYRGNNHIRVPSFILSGAPFLSLCFSIIFHFAEE
jgi:hypothetical protein